MKILKTLIKILLFAGAVYGVFKLVRKMNNGQLQLDLAPEPKKESPKFKPARRIDLNDRQQSIFDLIKKQKNVDIRDLNNIKGVTTRTLRRDLNKLIAEKLIRKEGKTKSARYILTSE